MSWEKLFNWAFGIGMTALVWLLIASTAWDMYAKYSATVTLTADEGTEITAAVERAIAKKRDAK